MSTLEVLNRIAVSSEMNFASAPSRQLDNGNWQIEGLRIFKTGTFKDSWGTQRTWESEHLQQMVFHYNMLKERGIFSNVPVRADHSSSVNNIVGYFTDLRAEDIFLVADLEITEPGAYEKWERGTYRSRSLEVGAYESNDEAVYWPTVMGVAFVDIPAVEGLHSKTKTEKLANFSLVMQDKDKENPVADTQTVSTTTEEKVTEATTAPAPSKPVTPPAPATPPTPSPTPTTGAEGEPREENEEEENTTTEGEPAASHSRGASQFRVNGQPVSDFAAVQRHIESLESFATETTKAARTNFVNNLATSNRIAATQIDSLTALALTMSDEQFKAFTGAYESAPASGLLGLHGQQSQATPATDAVASEIQTLEETVAMHKRAGMPEDALVKTGSYLRLQALKTTSGSAA